METIGSENGTQGSRNMARFDRATKFLRLVFAFSLALAVFQSNALWGEEPLDKFLNDHCAACHQENVVESQFDITKLSWRPEASSVSDLTRIYQRVEAGEMPPKGEVHPEEADRKQFLAKLSSKMIELDQQRIARDGRAVNRRLNRYEYENSLRNLLNLPWLQIRETLPEDGELHRYNKVGEALDVSHVHLSRYMNAAENSIRQAIGLRLDRPTRSKKRYYARDEFSLVGNFLPRENGTLPDRLSFPVLDSHAQPDVRSGEAPKSSPETREREAVGRVSSIFSDAGGYSWGQFRVPASGKYRIRFKGYSIWVSGGGMGRWFYEGFGDQKAPVFHMPLWHRPNADEVWPGRRSEPIGVYAQSSGKSRALGMFDFGVEPTECEIETSLVANEVVQTDGTRLFRTRVNGTDEQYVNPLATQAGMPGYAIQWMEVDGPMDDESTDSGYRLMFGDLPLKRLPATATGGLVLRLPAPPPEFGSAPPANGARPTTGPPLRRGFGGPRLVDVKVEVETTQPRIDADRLLRSFMQRAYDRTVEEPHVHRFLKLFDDEYSKGVGFANAMVTVYSAVLVSPGYFYLDYSLGKLDQHSLASRLSLFLWNSKPDAELRRIADDGRLLDPGVLKSQVDRLLDAPASRRFVDAFTDYWLDLRKIDETSPSTTLYSDYELDEPLKAAALEETRLYVARMFQENLPARVIVDSDFSFLNERLAMHYDIPNVTGSEMRLVKLPANSIRGGLMTQAMVLKVTANGTTTSPVIRGNWIAERVLGIRVAPPPSVPAVEPDIRGAVTIRQQLELHRNDASCAACHAKIDPPGLALEAFDVMGGFRERYRAVDENQSPAKGFGLNGQAFAFHYALPIDTAGTMPDGKPFKDIRELKSLILRDEKVVAKNLVGQLLIYATGTPITVSDSEHVNSILQQAEHDRYGARSVIHAIVENDLFLKK